VQLSLVGGFRLDAGEETLTVAESRLRLIGCVALHNRPQSRSVVAGTLWPDKSEVRACANVRSALWRAQVPNGCSPIVADGPLLRLSSNVLLDTVQFETIGWSVVADTSRAVEVDRRLFFQELLPGHYDDWIIIERERLALLGLHFLEAVTDGLSAAGRPAEALDTALRLVAADPLRERSQLALIRVLVEEGSTRRAFAQVESYVDLMTKTFGSAPDASFREAARALIQAGDGRVER
jgi:DNA-binding SARP family transcriptional activator